MCSLKYFLIAICVCTFFSCRKEKEIVYPPVRLSEVFHETRQLSSYHYLQDGRLKEIIFYGNNLAEISGKREAKYDSNNTIRAIDYKHSSSWGWDTITEEYVYSSNDTIKRINHYQNGRMIYFDEWHYPSADTVVIANHLINNTTPRWRLVNVYKNGNLYEQTEFNQDSIPITRFVGEQYDNYKLPYPYFPPNIKDKNKTNLIHGIKYESTNGKRIPEWRQTDVYDNQYEYLQNGYPSKQISDSFRVFYYNYEEY